jgi:hypothetical protein
LEEKEYPDCNYQESEHKNCCFCNQHRYRKDLCDDHFRIHLAGLTDGLNYRLHQLLWSEVEITLNNGYDVVGTIVFVGSNFVEMLLPTENGKPFEEFELEDGLTPEPDDRSGTTARTLIFPITEITSVEADGFCYEE